MHRIPLGYIPGYVGVSMIPCLLALELTTNEHGLIGDGVPNWNAAIQNSNIIVIVTIEI